MEAKTSSRTGRSGSLRAPRRAANGNGRTPASRAASDLFFDRELSWLEFNGRVLEEALNPSHPLLERLKFLAIFSNNLDEFFMIHVPGLRERVSAETGRAPTDRDIAVRLRNIQSKLTPMLATLSRCFQELLPQLAAHGICLAAYDELNEAEKERLAIYFENEVFPVLTPLALSPSHPFPYISNLSLSLAVIVRDPYSGQTRFARVKVPTRPTLPRLVPLPGAKWRFVLLEEVLSAHIERLFPGMEVLGCYPFRVTRNADMELREDVTEDLLTLIQEGLAKRRFGEIERLEFSSAMPEEIRQTIKQELGDTTEEEIYTIDGPLNLADFFPLASIDIPELRDPPFVPAIPPALRNEGDIFSAIQRGDILLHHPYQSFGCVEEFLRQAADDPQVLTIKHTLYRTSGDSPLLEALIDAADNGKQVACLVELKARFDEANNINWARQLEKSGVHVVYGLIGLKTHCKVTLVVRREEAGLRRYLHIGTGNYNPRTATIYTDLGLFTCDPDFGADASDLFNFLTGYSRQETYRKFLVAPIRLRLRLQEMIAREMERHTETSPGRIIAKMNALVDPALIKMLYAASQKGVQIDLIVRGMCCLRPGIPGLSENIRVISIIGRFLEHSRVFYFRNGGEDEIYMGSADWMPRNLDRRVEVVIPIQSPELLRHLRDEVFPILLQDNCQAWELQPDGSYLRRRPAENGTAISSQMALLERLTAA